MLSRILVTLSAIALVASATPSAELLKRAGQSIDPMSSFLERVPAVLHRKDGRTPEQVAQLALQVQPDTINTLNDALDTIIDQVVARAEDQQALVDTEVELFANCSQTATTDPEVTAKVTSTQAKIEPAENEVEASATGSLAFDFGKDSTTSAIEATRFKETIGARKTGFDEAHSDLEAAKSEAKLAQDAADKFAQIAKETVKTCLCGAHKNYKAVKETAQKATKNILADLTHFSLIKCVMKQRADNATDTAFQTCMDKAKDKTLVDFGLVEMDFKESEAQLDAETKEHCDRTPSPTPAPVPPTESPTKTFDTVLAGKAQEMVWAKYGKDQPTGQTLFGYGTGREIKLKRFVNMANVTGSLCDGDKSRPDCRYKDKNMLYRVAKLEAVKNNNIKAFCLNEDDVSYYLMSSVQSWVTLNGRCPTEDEVLMTPNDKTEDGKGVSDETDSFRWKKYLAPSEQCPGNKGCQWKKGGAPECQKAQSTKGEWTCYKQYGQTDPDLCNKGGVCAGYGR
jgi:hypothetical protein